MARDIWFISDTHFGHENIIYHCQRPFEDAQDMDEELIRLWNERVKPDDLVYHLGDFAWTVEDAKRVRPLLNGSIRLVVGNHDPIPALAATGIFQKMVESRKGGVICKELAHCLFTHRPIALDEFDGSVNVHGHIHNLSSPNSTGLNLSVEVIDYRPMHIDELIERAKR